MVDSSRAYGQVAAKKISSSSRADLSCSRADLKQQSIGGLDRLRGKEVSRLGM